MGLLQAVFATDGLSYLLTTLAHMALPPPPRSTPQGLSRWVRRYCVAAAVPYLTVLLTPTSRVLRTLRTTFWWRTQSTRVLRCS